MTSRPPRLSERLITRIIRAYPTAVLDPHGDELYDPPVIPILFAPEELRPRYEDFRVNLEDTREGLEAARASGAIPLAKYHEGIASYRLGIALYRRGLNDYRGCFETVPKTASLPTSAHRGT